MALLHDLNIAQKRYALFLQFRRGYACGEPRQCRSADKSYAPHHYVGGALSEALDRSL
jgi:hypothetical protein